MDREQGRISDRGLEVAEGADVEVAGPYLGATSLRMRDEVARELARVERLPVGSGRLEAMAFARGDSRGGSAGGAIDYSHHIADGLAAFGRGEVGRQWGERRGLVYEALAGVRWSF